jgi:hypothetical protein
VELASLMNFGDPASLAGAGFTDVAWSISSTLVPASGSDPDAVYVANPSTAMAGLNPLTGSARVLPVRGTSSTVPRTGRTTSVRAGDDGAVRAGVAWPGPRFSSFDDGYCVTDHLTGLMWPAHANLPAAAQTWEAAIDFVTTTMNGTWAYCGFSDWRLPNIVELHSLQDAETPYRPAFLGRVGFHDVASTAYWSSTTVHGSSSFAHVLMADGMLTSRGKTSVQWVHPVRTATP